MPRQQQPGWTLDDVKYVLFSKQSLEDIAAKSKRTVGAINMLRWGYKVYVEKGKFSNSVSPKMAEFFKEISEKKEFKETKSEETFSGVVSVEVKPIEKTEEPAPVEEKEQSEDEAVAEIEEIAETFLSEVADWVDRQVALGNKEILKENRKLEAKLEEVMKDYAGLETAYNALNDKPKGQTWADKLRKGLTK